ncbi:hypothetical protein [Chitinophaga caeni]|nr:hypothetical protein [Chitinophaga caeni]
MKWLAFLCLGFTCTCSCNPQPNSTSSNPDSCAYLPASRPTVTQMVGDYNLSVYPVGATDFEKQSKLYGAKMIEPSIGNYESAKNMIGKRVRFKKISLHGADQYLLRHIDMEDLPVEFSKRGLPLYFYAYFPKSNVLSLVDSLSTDYTIDLSSGNTTDLIGNPEYTRNNPDGSWRIIGAYDGEGCVWYTLQFRDGKKYLPFTALNFLNLCSMTDYFWISRDVLYYSTQDDSLGLTSFYKLIIDKY